MKLLFILLLGLGFTQTKLETRVYEIYRDWPSGGEEIFDLQIITGFSLDYALVQPIDFDSEENWSVICVEQNGENDNRGCLVRANSGVVHFRSQQHNTKALIQDNTFKLRDAFCGGILKIAVTAEFPEEDTGYIEEGYQFCVQPGANLLSFPCDNPISVNQSLPQGAENFITQIVGQGVAATYNPALGWVGSLDNFSPGSGYWFKSNESLCFEYDCVED